MHPLEAHPAQKAKNRRTRNSFGRAKAKAFRNAQALHPVPEGWEYWEYVDWVRDRYVISHYRNRCVYSSYWYGGNIRRHAKGEDAVTLAEHRADIAFAEQWAEHRECATE